MSRFAFAYLGILLLLGNSAMTAAQSQKDGRPLPTADQGAPEKTETATLALG